MGRDYERFLANALFALFTGKRPSLVPPCPNAVLLEVRDMEYIDNIRVTPGFEAFPANFHENQPHGAAVNPKGLPSANVARYEWETTVANR
jgi:hypothetical protein